jgi:serine phosphatase RsbU (regulator of sigma subunit)/putative methionine-R-sulfoxide reductase with GAF domain
MSAFTSPFTWTIFLTALLVSAFVLYRRYRSRQALVQRIAEMEALGEAGQAIVAAQMDVKEFCELIAQVAGKVVDNRTFQIGLFENGHYHIQFWTINGARQPEGNFDLSESSGVVGWIRQSRQALLVHDFTKEMDRLPARPRYISDTPPRSAIFIPLISGDQAIGVLAAQSSEPNRFDEHDLQRLRILANQAAAAIANARLFEQERMRAAHLELVGQIARQVNAIQETDELFQEVVLLTRETFGFHPVNIFSLNPQTGDIIIQASSVEGLLPGSFRITEGRGLIASAVHSRQMTLSNDTQEDSRYLPDVGVALADIATQTTRAEIVIPLVVDEEVLGVLDVHSDRPGVFTRQEQTVLQALAAQVAIAIHKARQFAAQREQAWMSTAQLQVAEAIGQSSDLDDLLSVVARLTPMLVGVDQCALLIWDADMNAYRGAAVYGAEPEVVQAFDNCWLRLGDWNALDAVHVGKEPLTSRQSPPWTRPAAGSEACCTRLYPLLVKAQLLGVLVTIEAEDAARNSLPDAPAARRDELARSITNQAAQAIESVQLRLAQQEEAWVNTALLQVAEAVNSLIDLNEILHTIVRLVPMLVGVDSCIVLIWDGLRQTFRAGPSYGLSEMGHGLIETFEVEAAEFPLSQTTNEEFFDPETAHCRLALPRWLQSVLGARTADTFPLHARGALVGALLVGPPVNGRPLSGRRLQILTGIAQQAAIAVVNDQLYRESAERSRLEQELEVARTIQASLIPAGNPNIPGCTVASFWNAARQVSGDFYDFLQLPGGRWGIAIADVADKGVPAALFMALSRTILRAVAFNSERPAETLRQANQLIFADSQANLFVTVFYAVWDPKTRCLTYSSGGHNPPLIIREGKPSLLAGNGIALGVLEEVEIEQREVRFRPGDVLVMYTDGVTEAMNEDLDEFGLERLSLAAAAARHRDAAGVMSAITTALADHVGHTPQFDDITLVVMKCQ